MGAPRGRVEEEERRERREGERGLLCDGRIIRVEIVCGVCARVAIVWLGGV